MNIIISGTSSAGKSSIIDKFPKQYNKISWDNVFDEFGYNFLKFANIKILKINIIRKKKKINFLMIVCMEKLLVN